MQPIGGITVCGPRSANHEGGQCSGKGTRAASVQDSVILEGAGVRSELSETVPGLIPAISNETATGLEQCRTPYPVLDETAIVSIAIGQAAFV